MQSKAIELTCLTRVAQDAKCFMAFGAIELTRLTRVAQDAPVRLWWHRMPSATWPGYQSKAIKLNLDGTGCQELHILEINRTHQALHGLDINRRQSNSTWMEQDAKSCISWRSIELTSSTRVAQDAKHFMILRAIEGNRTHPFDSSGTGCQALHGLEINRRQSNSPI